MNRECKWTRVVAIDPAPGKKSTVFDGDQFLDFGAVELRKFLVEPCNRTPNTLICWDSPLTGPASPSAAGSRLGDFTQRPIEKFFSRKETCFRVPSGISVRPYGGCPHWTISRSLLGLPRTGPYDRHDSGLPFHLLPSPEAEHAQRASIVEIHPAVAAWLWCLEERGRDADWIYKGSRGSKRSREIVRQEMWSIIVEKAGFNRSGLPTPRDDDQFDAAVGFILGSLYADGDGSAKARAMILGSRETGSFLLPAGDDLKETWDQWSSKELAVRSG